MLGLSNYVKSRQLIVDLTFSVDFRLFGSRSPDTTSIDRDLKLFFIALVAIQTQISLGRFAFQFISLGWGGWRRRKNECDGASEFQGLLTRETCEMEP
jgi:hypothetical protein